MRVAFAGGSDWRRAVADAGASRADVVCLPHLSFAPYIAGARDRGGLEHAERSPSPSLREALGLAGGAWVSATAYESEGEGVFYVTAYLARAGGPTLRNRQRRVEAESGRWEQMFWSPGHEPLCTLATPWGPATALAGADLRDAEAWSEAAASGARIVFGGASEAAALWERTCRVVSGMCAAHGLAACVANRSGAEHGVRFAGGPAAFAPDGASARVVDGVAELGVPV